MGVPAGETEASSSAMVIRSSHGRSEFVGSGMRELVEDRASSRPFCLSNRRDRERRVRACAEPARAQAVLPAEVE